MYVLVFYGVFVLFLSTWRVHGTCMVHDMTGRLWG